MLDVLVAGVIIKEKDVLLGQEVREWLGVRLTLSYIAAYSLKNWLDVGWQLPQSFQGQQIQWPNYFSLTQKMLLYKHFKP